MRILQVIDRLGLQYGGSAMSARKMTEALLGLGHDVTVYTSDAGLDTLNGWSGFPVVHAFKTVAVFQDAIHITPSMLKADFRGFDVIHCHNYYTFQNIVVRLRCGGTPLVLQPQGTFVLYDGLIKQRKVQLAIDPVWRRWFLRYANTIVCVSGLEEKQSRKLGLENTVLVPNGIDTAEYAALPARGAFRAKHNIPADAHVILYLGRDNWIKGLDRLYCAYRKIKSQDSKAVLVCVGVTNTPDGVIGLPQLYGDDKLSAYVDADVFALPSLYEIFGITILETAACGTPSVIMQGCGLEGFLRGEPGEPVVTVPEHLAEAIIHVLRRTAKGRDRDERIQFAQQFTWDKAAKQMEEVYRDTIDRYNAHV